jgi:hypothetical protein
MPDQEQGAAVPAPFDTSVAHQSRIYDYWLGRKIEVFYPGEQ